MKKIYLKPNTLLVQIELQQMIAGTTLNGEGNNPFTDAAEGGYEEGGDSRYYDDWDD